MVTIASGGIVFAPGSAGTVQEVFQNATVNYYKKAPLRATPMVFLGRAFWNPAAYDPPQQSLGHPKPLYPLVEKLARDASSAMNGFTEALLLSDDPVLIAKFIDEHVCQELPTFADLRVQTLIGGRLNWGSSD